MIPSLAIASSSSTMLLCPKLGTCSMSLSTCTPTSHSKIQHFHLYSLGKRLFTPWNGLKQLGFSTDPKKPLFHFIGRKGRCKGKVVYASLFGVGAPEALVIGVVALLVFGPKGLAEVARNLGKTLREFQPTIREIQDVSREFKSTLEREIGIDDITNPLQSTYSSNVRNTTSTPSATEITNSSPPSATEITNSSQTAVDPNGKLDESKAYSSEEYLKITEEQLKAIAAQQQEQTPSPKEEKIEQQIQPPANETAATLSSPQKPESESLPSDS
ncbi:sec-independent protein translocase protein TATB, chloroplastic [Vicia villosa]|uniref:sec-independent protein translocase protein TATB, chloroplastic n=1 Tax=Vicia villosa TaxID=3911 RepID=UPI00273C3257|nr:sec-independent protein translocase protein TATB, chloroplastic [Vicia villosa]